MWGLVFPGQGSQHTGMGKFLYENFSVAKECFEEASDVLSQDFKKLCFEGPDSDLMLTENTQPALVLTSVATHRVLNSLGLKVKSGAGHSVGEYSAVVAAGGLRFSDAVRLVRLRGQAMQEAVPVGEGGMLAVMGLTDPDVEKFCKWAEAKSGLTPLEPANFNAPGQVVVSGSADLCTWAKENFTPDKIESDVKKVRLIPLKVSAPFHCSMMNPAQEKMQAALAGIEFKDTEWPIAQNVTGELVTNATEIRTNLVKQISGSVKWTHCMHTLKGSGVSKLVESGPGKVLSGLAKKIDSEGLKAFNINSLEDIKALEEAL